MPKHRNNTIKPFTVRPYPAYRTVSVSRPTLARPCGGVGVGRTFKIHVRLIFFLSGDVC